MESWAGVDSPTPSDGEAVHALHGWAPLDEVLEPGLSLWGALDDNDAGGDSLNVVDEQVEDNALQACPPPAILLDPHGHMLPLETLDTSVAATEQRRRRPVRSLFAAVRRSVQVLRDLAKAAKQRVLPRLVDGDVAVPPLVDAPLEVALPADVDDDAADGGAVEALLVPVAAGADGDLVGHRQDGPSSDDVAQQIALTIEQVAAIISANPSARATDTLSDDVVRHYLFRKSRSMGFTVEAESLGVDLRTAQTLLHASASACHLVQRRDAARMMEQLHRDICSSGGAAIEYIEELRYDETPMKMRLHDTEPSVNIPAADPAATIEHLKRVLPISAACKATHVAKILQTSRSCHLLYKLHGADSSYLLVNFDVLCWLQCLSRGRGENYYRALGASEFLPPPAVLEDFRFKTHLVCTDGDKAVDRCERAWAAAHPETTQLVTKCEIHKCYNIHESVFDQMDSHRQRMVHIALALCGGDSMRQFRTTMRTLLAGGLIDYRPNSRPLYRELQHNVRLMDLFLAGADATSRMRRSIVLSLANGDWTIQGKVIHHCCGCCLNEGDCINKFLTLFVAAVASKQPTVWPKSRWSGAEDAVGWLGVIESVHGLLSLTFQEWAQVPPPKGRKGAAVQVDAGRSADDPQVEGALEMQGDGDVDGGLHLDFDAGREGHERDDDVGVKGEPLATDWEARRKEHSKYKYSGCHWFRTSAGHSVLGVLYIVRSVLGPLCGWMGQLLAASGEAWERGQQLREAKASRDGHPNKLHRDFHALLAAENTCENQCLDATINLIQDAELWSALPALSRIAAVRQRVFSLLSCIGCLVHELRVAHQGYPWKMFRLLVDTDLAEEIEKDCCRLRDPWSESLYSSYIKTSDGLNNIELKARLGAIVRLLRREMAQIEANHAAVRRALKLNSVQTHSVLFQHMSAQRSTKLVRNLSARLRPGFQRPKRQALQNTRRDAPAQPPEQLEIKTHHGGGWRAYIRERTLGSKGRPHFKAIAEEYRALSAEEHQRFRRVGRVASKHRRQGATTHTFGETTRQVERRSQKRQNQLALESLAKKSKPDVDRPSNLALLPLAPRSADDAVVPSFWSRLSTLKKNLTMQARAICLQKHRAEQDAIDIINEEAAGDFAKTCAIIPALQCRGSEVIPERSPEKHTLQVCSWSPIGVPERVAKALSTTVGGFRAQLLEALVATWSKLCETVDFEEITVFNADKAKLEANPCFEAGMCLCTPHGKVLKSFQTALESKLKKVCPPKSANRKKLTNGDVVLVLLGQEKPAGDGEQDLLFEDALLQTVPIKVVKWLHVGHQCLAPWRASYHIMDGPLFDPTAIVADEVVRLQASCRFATKWEAVVDLDFDLRWCCMLCHAAFFSHPLGTFKPNCFEGVLKHDTVRLVWAPFRRPRKKPVRKDRTMSSWVHVDDGDGAVGGAIADADGGVHHAPIDGSDDGSDGPGEVEGEESYDDLAVEGSDHDGDIDLECGDFFGGEPDASDIEAIEEVVEAIEELKEADDDAELEPGDEPEHGIEPELEAMHDPPVVAPVFPEGDPPIPPGPIAVKTAMGSLTFYPSCNDFVAVCKCPAHRGGDCRKQRPGYENAKFAAQGRPLGYLAAWLEAQAAYDTAIGHKWACVPSFEVRVAARNKLALTLEGRFLLRCERPPRADEGIEPLFAP